MFTHFKQDRLVKDVGDNTPMFRILNTEFMKCSHGIILLFLKTDEFTGHPTDLSATIFNAYYDYFSKN
jgi:hypothetical protein